MGSLLCMAKVFRFYAVGTHASLFSWQNRGEADNISGAKPRMKGTKKEDSVIFPKFTESIYCKLVCPDPLYFLFKLL